MISRVVTCNVKPEKLTQFRHALSAELLPEIQRQPGFVDVLESIDTNTGHFVCTTLWKSKEDVERYDQGLFQEVAQQLTPLVNGQPDIKTLTVENSTAHHIHSGTKSVAA